MTRVNQSVYTTEQHHNLLMHYFILLKKCSEMAEAFPELGNVAPYLPKSYLYALAGKRAFYSPDAAGRYIRRMLDDRHAIDAAKRLMEEWKKEK
jgi:hypothetical protein